MNQVEIPHSQTGVLVENLLDFVQVLRRAGLPVSTTQVMDFCRALALIDLRQRAQVYHATRGILVTRHDHLRLFDTLFNSFWTARLEALDSAPQKAPRAPRHDQEHQPVLIANMARKA